MQRKMILGVALAYIAFGALALTAGAQTHQHDIAAPASVQSDTRQLVKFSESMRLRTISKRSIYSPGTKSTLHCPRTTSTAPRGSPNSDWT